MTKANLNNILLIVLMVQMIVLTARFAAWRQAVRRDETPPDNGDIRPEAAGGSLGPVLTSAYSALVLFGGLLANRALAAPPLTIVTVLVVLILPALLIDGLLSLRQVRS